MGRRSQVIALARLGGATLLFVLSLYTLYHLWQLGHTHQALYQDTLLSYQRPSVTTTITAEPVFLCHSCDPIIHARLLEASGVFTCQDCNHTVPPPPPPHAPLSESTLGALRTTYASRYLDDSLLLCAFRCHIDTSFCHAFLLPALAFLIDPYDLSVSARPTTLVALLLLLVALAAYIPYARARWQRWVSKKDEADRAIAEVIRAAVEQEHSQIIPFGTGMHQRQTTALPFEQHN